MTVIGVTEVTVTEVTVVEATEVGIEVTVGGTQVIPVALCQAETLSAPVVTATAHRKKSV